MKPTAGSADRRPNPYDANCPTRQILDRIGDKWAVLVLGRLARGPVRFNRLRREIEGISQKMLAQTLRELERDGLIHRAAFATVPVTVEYSIAPLGQTLTGPIEALSRWAETHMADVAAARERYDRAAEAA